MIVVKNFKKKTTKKTPRAKVSICNNVTKLGFENVKLKTENPIRKKSLFTLFSCSFCIVAVSCALSNQEKPVCNVMRYTVFQKLNFLNTYARKAVQKTFEVLIWGCMQFKLSF